VTKLVIGTQHNGQTFWETKTLAFRIYNTSFFSHCTKDSVCPCCCVSGKRILLRMWLWRA